MEIQKTSPLSFQGYKSKVGRKIERLIENGIITPIEREEISKLLDKKIKPERCCGIGMHGAVYKIDDYYVVKVPSKRDAYDRIQIDEGIVPQIFKHLKTYFGEAVARIKDFYILKNVSGKEKIHTQIGVPLELFKEMPTYKLYNEENLHKLREHYRKTSLPALARTSQKSYDAIAKDCDQLNKMGDNTIQYMFDYKNPNNFVIVGPTLRVIDAIYKTNEYKKPQNTIPSLLTVFLNRIGYELSAHYDEKFVKMRREIFKKVILAGIKHNLPVENTTSGEYIYKQALKLIGLEDFDHFLFEKALNDISKIENTQTRVKFAKHVLRIVYREMPNFKSSAQQT